MTEGQRDRKKESRFVIDQNQNLNQNQNTEIMVTSVPKLKLIYKPKLKYIQKPKHILKPEFWPKLIPKPKFPITNNIK